jgi:crotonobetainyl-CoA:carnitine CoA-transferase CaiB-like acyl-CoA transferase
MTHGSHRFVAHRLGGEAVPRLLTGGLASYRIYETADGRHLTVAALEHVFFRRLTELLGRPELAERQFDAEQEALAAELAVIFAARPLAEWQLFRQGGRLRWARRDDRRSGDRPGLARVRASPAGRPVTSRGD